MEPFPYGLWTNMYSIIKQVYYFNVICLVWFQSYSIHFFVHCFNSCDIWMPMLAVDLVFDQLFCGRRHSNKTQLMIYYPDQICLSRSKNRSFATSSCVSTTQEDFPLISYHFHTWYLSFFLHWQNFLRIKFTPKNANFSR